MSAPPLLEFPPLIPESRLDPFPAYDALRDEGPVVRRTLPDGMPVWCITRYSDALTVLRDPRFSQDSRHAAALFERMGRARPALRRGPLARTLLALDPPDHTRLRRLIAQAFTARRVEAARPRIQEITESLLDEVAPRGTADLIADLAFPLPVFVICELLGVPGDDRAKLQRWSHLLTSFPASAAEQAAVAAAAADICAYFGDVIAQKAREPGEDLISALILARDEGDRLTDDEILANTVFLIIAGHETTAALIGNSVLALLRDPSRAAALRENPALLATAVDELLRYDGPVSPGISRFTSVEVEVGGVTIPAGQYIMVLTSAANRDPARFAQPGSLDLARADNPHIGFGHGRHTCIGAQLARVEGQIAIGTIVRRFPDLELAVPIEELRWLTRSVFRSLERLPVRFTASQES